jgi:hypothetical protein
LSLRSSPVFSIPRSRSAEGTDAESGTEAISPAGRASAGCSPGARHLPRRDLARGLRLGWLCHRRSSWSSRSWAWRRTNLPRSRAAARGAQKSAVIRDALPLPGHHSIGLPE